MVSKVAIVSGAASGIGLELTRNLIADGWKVVMADVNAVQGEKLSQEFGAATAFYRTDVSKWDEHAALFKFAKAKFGRIDLVAANAGIGDQQNLYEKQVGEPAKPNLKTLDVDLVAVIYAVWLAAHYFRQNGKEGGKIIITSSDAGLYPLPLHPQYAAAKHGVKSSGCFSTPQNLPTDSE
jgi:15-hydroxyprostaglandin dehydrogenase (NAD)